MNFIDNSLSHVVIVAFEKKKKNENHTGFVARMTT